MRRISIISIFALFLLLAANAYAIDLEFWHSEVEQNRVETFARLIEKFEAENPDIKVKQVPIEENDMRIRLATAEAAGVFPDIASLSQEMILRYGGAGLLSTEAAESTVADLGRDDFYKGGLDYLTGPAGELYGVPYTGWVQGIWYRKDWFAEAGLEAPLAWEDIKAAAEKFNDAPNRVYGIVIGTDKDVYAEQVFTQFALSNEALLFDKDGNVTFDTPQMIEALTFYNELDKFTPPGPTTWRDARDLYLNGTLAMMFYSTFIMDDIGIGRTGFKGAVVPDLVHKTGFAPYIEHKVKASYGPVSGFGIFKSSKEIEADKKFIKFLMKKDDYIKIMHMAPGGFNPMLKSVATSQEFLGNEILQAWGETYKTIAAGLENIKTFAFAYGQIFPVFGDISAQFITGDAINRMTQKGVPPADAAKWAQEEMEKTVARAKEE